MFNFFSKKNFIIEYITWFIKSLNRDLFLFYRFQFFYDGNVWIIFMLKNVFRHISMIVQTTMIFTTCQSKIWKLIMDTNDFLLYLTSTSIKVVHFIVIMFQYMILSRIVFKIPYIYSLWYIFLKPTILLYTYIRNSKKNWKNCMIIRYGIDLIYKWYLHIFSTTDYNFLILF